MRDLSPNRGGPMMLHPFRPVPGRIGVPVACIGMLDPLGCEGAHP